MCFATWYVLFFLFKQKTAYEMRISDWSSDVCSSDLLAILRIGLLESLRCGDDAVADVGAAFLVAGLVQRKDHIARKLAGFLDDREIGRASCRERVCQYV